MADLSPCKAKHPHVYIQNAAGFSRAAFSFSMKASHTELSQQAILH